MDSLLWPCWRGANDAYKAKYARTIWQQFEEKVRSAAYTASLTRFLESLRSKMDIEIRKDDLASIANAMVFEPRWTLSALRKETTALVVMVRLRNEERKADYLAKVESRKADRAWEDSLNRNLFSETMFPSGEEERPNEDLFPEGDSHGAVLDLA